MKRLYNLILNNDAYKQSHYSQLKPSIEFSSSYIEARGSENPKIKEICFFGLQMFIEDYMSNPITQEEIDYAAEMLPKVGLTFNREGWEYILKTYNGYLPLRIQAIPEGSIVPIGTPLVQIENTDQKVPWLSSMMETSILRGVWYPTTVATKSREIKKVLKKGMIETAGHVDGLEFMLHDFGARGVSSQESAAIGGLAHLVNFVGTDTLAAILYGREFYDIDIAGYSIPASEHSTITSWGMQNELIAFENMLNQYGQDGKIFACVSDSYNIYDACREYWGDELKDRVIEFGSRGGRTVVRPDSGPLLETPSVPIECVEILMEKFGFRTNELGYKILPDYIRVIQGDGWKSEKDFEDFIKLVKKAKLSLENFAFGMGGGLLQNVNRDTFKFAMKCSSVMEDGKRRNVYKNPFHKGKKSKRGYITGVNIDGKYSSNCLFRWNVF